MHCATLPFTVSAFPHMSDSWQPFESWSWHPAASRALMSAAVSGYQGLATGKHSESSWQIAESAMDCSLSSLPSFSHSPSWPDFGEKLGPLASPPSPPSLLTLKAGALQHLLNPLEPRGNLISCLPAQFRRMGWFISQPLALCLA